MNRRIIMIISAILIFTGCSAGCSKAIRKSDSKSKNRTEQIGDENSSDDEKKESSRSGQKDETDRIGIEDAYEKLKSVSSRDEETEALFQKLGLLKNCSGRFLQMSEDSGNVYTADIDFYLVDDEVYCSINYTGYMGEIADGIVSESQHGEYSFESFPKGDLYGREQEFKIYFSNEKLHISWGSLGNTTCEYVLTRGDGSVENAQERRESFEDTGTLDTINETVDAAFSSCPHNVIYDKDLSSITISIQIDGARSAFQTNDSELLSRWQPVVDQIVLLDEQFYEAVSILQYEENGTWWPYVYDVHFYIVDKLNNSGKYSDDEILLWVTNGKIQYNIANSTPDSSKTNSTVSATPSNNGHTVTSGERNALETAKDYLSFMSFSYNGLIEQLKYEGYSNSEAVYGADNCGADWNPQAVKKAKEYLSFMNMSKSELVEQLEYEGFTHEQAVYGANHA